MSKTKERSEVEHIRAENKKLKSENRHLKKQLARFEKRKHLLDDVEEREKDLDFAEAEQELGEVVESGRCECGGKINIVDIGVKKLEICEDCRARKVKKT